jgi:hypothetical protein
MLSRIPLGTGNAQGYRRIDLEPAPGNGLPAVKAFTILAAIEAPESHFQSHYSSVPPLVGRLSQGLALDRVHAGETSDALLI